MQLLPPGMFIPALPPRDVSSCLSSQLGLKGHPSGSFLLCRAWVGAPAMCPRPTLGTFLSSLTSFLGLTLPPDCELLGASDLWGPCDQGFPGTEHRPAE